MASQCDITGCVSELNLSKLCCADIKACSIEVADITITGTQTGGSAGGGSGTGTGSGCPTLLSSPSICGGNIIGKEVDGAGACFTQLGATNACIQTLNSANGSIATLSVNNLCVSGTLTAANSLNCGVYKASVVFGKLNTYTLGTPLNFDTIVSDPNNNITLAPTAYKAPVAGDYLAVLQVNIQNLLPAAGPILGTPIADPQLYVNGVLVREAYWGFMNFYPQQKSNLVANLSLKLGDIVTAQYNILSLNSSNGLITVAGTVDILGDGTENNTSSLKLELLSATCAAGNVTACAPVIPCTPCVPMTCVPCTPA
jgi:hypothetical protein